MAGSRNISLIDTLPTSLLPRLYFSLLPSSSFPSYTPLKQGEDIRRKYIREKKAQDGGSRNLSLINNLPPSSLSLTTTTTTSHFLISQLTKDGSNRHDK